MPHAQIHDFGKDRLQWGARIDFNRGSAKDDRGNHEWITRWIQHLPQYKSTLTQDPRSDNGRGNAVEQAAGVAFAAVTNDEHLAHGRLDWTRNGAIESCKSAWASVWIHFQARGLGLTVDLADEDSEAAAASSGAWAGARSAGGTGATRGTSATELPKSAFKSARA